MIAFKISHNGSYREYVMIHDQSGVKIWLRLESSGTITEPHDKTSAMCLPPPPGFSNLNAYLFWRQFKL
jgi:hypothetical protein